MAKIQEDQMKKYITLARRFKIFYYATFASEGVSGYHV